MKEKTKTFDLADVLTITTGKLVSKRHMDGVYGLLGFMTGENLFTHVLGRAADICNPWLIPQLPADIPNSDNLAELEDMPNVSTKEKLAAFLKPLEEKYGNSFELKALPKGIWESKNPLEELASIMSEDQELFAVTIPDGDGDESN